MRSNLPVQGPPSASGEFVIACQDSFRLGALAFLNVTLTLSILQVRLEWKGQSAELQMNARQVTSTLFAREVVKNNASVGIPLDGTQRLGSVRSSLRLTVPI